MKKRGRTVMEALGQDAIESFLNRIDTMPWPDIEKRERRDALQAILDYHPFDNKHKLSDRETESILRNLGILVSGPLGPISPFTLPDEYYTLLKIALSTAYHKGRADGRERQT